MIKLLQLFLVALLLSGCSKEEKKIGLQREQQSIEIDQKEEPVFQKRELESEDAHFMKGKGLFEQEKWFEAYIELSQVKKIHQEEVESMLTKITKALAEESNRKWRERKREKERLKALSEKARERMVKKPSFLEAKGKIEEIEGADSFWLKYEKGKLEFLVYDRRGKPLLQERVGSETFFCPRSWAELLIVVVGGCGECVTNLNYLQVTKEKDGLFEISGDEIDDFRNEEKHLTINYDYEHNLVNRVVFADCNGKYAQIETSKIERREGFWIPTTIRIIRAMPKEEKITLLIKQTSIK